MINALYKVTIKVNFGDFSNQVLTTDVYYLQSMKACLSVIAIFTDTSGAIESVEIKRMTLAELKKVNDNVIVSNNY